MSWESSIEYERLINQGARERLSGSHSADLVIRSYDFATIEALQAAGEWDAMANLLAADAIRLEESGAEVIALCTNTMHCVAEHIEAGVEPHWATSRAGRRAGWLGGTSTGRRRTRSCRPATSAATSRLRTPPPRD
ncbi:MAG: aspartate/glutamate racemase family protein [Ilumatobacteraceae bacterium]|nr:aspartate/glutamate racemase family protein [Ilumatobacteraceae bacterium]